MKKLLLGLGTSVKTLIILAVMLLGIGYVYAANTWVGAPGSAPNANKDAPLNVGSADQSKGAGLALTGNFVASGANIVNVLQVGTASTVGTLQIGNSVKPGVLKFVDNNQANGKILASDENGSARWVSTSSLGVGGGSGTGTVGPQGPAGTPGAVCSWKTANSGTISPSTAEGNGATGFCKYSKTGSPTTIWYGALRTCASQKTTMICANAGDGNDCSSSYASMSYYTCDL